MCNLCNVHSLQVKMAGQCNDFMMWSTPVQAAAAARAEAAAWECQACQ